MRVIVAGPRNFTDREIVREAMNDFHKQNKITEVVSGMANGVDTIGKELAEKAGVPVKEFPADWKNLDVTNCSIKEGKYGKYNALAGLNRNEEMADYADALIAIDSGTPGTAHMIKIARDKGLKVVVVKYVRKNNGYRTTDQ